MNKAFCIELGRPVSISEARHEFFARPEPRKRFNFECSTLDCLQPDGTRTRVSGVNYDNLLIEIEKEIYRAPHFRLFQKTTHHPDCEWHENNIPKKQSEQQDTKTSKNRPPKQDLIIDVFRFPTVQTEEGKKPPEILKTDRVKRSEEQPVSSGKQSPANHENKNRSNHFEELVYCYREAKSKMTSEMFKDLKFNIVNEGEFYYSTFFSHITSYKSNQIKAYYAGCNFQIYPKKFDLENDSGNFGFALYFFDKVKIDDDEIGYSFYVPAQTLSNYKNRQTLREIFKRKAEYDYLYAYFLNPKLEINEQGYMEIKIPSLDYLALIPCKKSSNETHQP